jgi:hypothetical protein
MAAVTTTKQTNKKKQENTIEIVSKSKYEKLVRSHERVMDRVQDLEDLVKCMRSEDRNIKGFIFNI